MRNFRNYFAPFFTLNISLIRKIFVLFLGPLLLCCRLILLKGRLPFVAELSSRQWYGVGTVSAPASSVVRARALCLGSFFLIPQPTVLAAADSSFGSSESCPTPFLQRPTWLTA